jgi:uncharacterized protein (TIGR00106 family)
LIEFCFYKIKIYYPQKKMIIAEFAIFPTSEGSSVSKYVKEAIKVIESSGLHHETGGMSTTVEAPDLDTLFKVIARCHEALVKMGAKRIHIDLRVDHRLDAEASIESKLKAVGKR